MKTLKIFGCAFAVVISWTQMAAAQSDLRVDSFLSELKIGHYGQPGCNHGLCPNVEASVLPAASGSTEDSLQIKLNIQPAGCNGNFVFKNAVSQYTEFGADGAPPVYHFFDSISLDQTASPCMGVEPRMLVITESIRLAAGRTRIRFLQMNGQYTEVSYESVIEGKMKRIRDLRVENNK